MQYRVLTDHDQGPHGGWGRWEEEEGEEEEEGREDLLDSSITDLQYRKDDLM